MKKHYSLLLVVLFLILAQGVFWSCGPAKNHPQNIFVRYNIAMDSLYLSDSQNGPETPAHNHIRQVAKGERVQWNWRGPHHNLEMETVTPKETDPFSEVKKVGKHLVAQIKSDIPNADYGYNIIIIINGDTTTFDPTLQIH